MYIVHNLTTKTVILSDLRVEIGPRKIMDLERVSPRDLIDRSRDLRQAIKTHQLRLEKYSVIKTNQPLIIQEKQAEKDQINDLHLKKLITQTIREEIHKQQVASQEINSSTDIHEMIRKTVGNGVQDIQTMIRDQINSFQPTTVQPDDNNDDMIIDPKQIADLQQKSINKISEDIQTGGSYENKQIHIINTNVKNLADEL